MKPFIITRSPFAAAFVAALMFALPAATHAADVFGPPSTIDYQGRVLDVSGNALAPTTPANFEIQFRIYDSQSGSNVIWAEKQLVTVSKGQFSVRLGEGTAIAGQGTVDHDSVGLPGAFQGRERYLGVTVVIPGQTAAEIQPRLAFLASPFSYVASAAMTLQQPSGTFGTVGVGAVSYSTTTMTAGVSTPNVAISTTSEHTVLADASAVTAMGVALPGGGANREFFIAKKDATAAPVNVSAPAGGTLNGVTDGSVRLKVRGESVTVQNAGGNDWWIVSESRDRPPPGTIIPFGGATPPAGYLACDGASVSRATYPDLFSALSTSWGALNGTTFSIPNLLGRFLRGKDPTGGTDDGVNQRFAFYTGGASGASVGSYQNEDYRSHNHGVNDPGHSHSASTFLTSSLAMGWRGYTGTYGNGTYAYGPSGVNDAFSTQGVSNATYATSVNSSGTGISINASGGSETRPDNAAVTYCIKF